MLADTVEQVDIAVIQEAVLVDTVVFLVIVELLVILA